jgi:CRP-like cAMP-binding protein
MPALAGPRFALTLAALPALALGFSLRPGPSVPHLPSLQHRHELLNMIAPAPRPKPIDRLLNPLRRQVYTLLKPVDKGEFRWEFLVPWVNRTLTATDKFIVCSTFIGASFVAQTLFDPGASVGVHLSYIAQFFSYAMGDPVGFRTLAVLTSIFEIVGDLFETKNAGWITGASFIAKEWYVVDAEDVFPIIYNILFVVINSYYILRWLVTREALLNALEWSEDSENVYRGCFKPLGFQRAQFSRLVPFTSIETNSANESRPLTVQGEPLTDVFVLLEGTLEVRVSGTLATRLPPYQLVGEASLLENLQSPGGDLQQAARATIVALPGSKYVRWSQRTFYDLQQEEDGQFAAAVQLMIARTLSRKLGDARRQTGRRSVPASRGRGAGSSESSSSGAEAQALLARTARQQERVAELELELAQSKAMVSEMTGLLFAVACLVGIAGFSATQGLSGPLSVLGELGELSELG